MYLARRRDRTEEVEVEKATVRLVPWGSSCRLAVSQIAAIDYLFSRRPLRCNCPLPIASSKTDDTSIAGDWRRISPFNEHTARSRKAALLCPALHRRACRTFRAGPLPPLHRGRISFSQPWLARDPYQSPQRYIHDPLLDYYTAGAESEISAQARSRPPFCALSCSSA